MLDLEKTPTAVPYGSDAYDLESYRVVLAALCNPQDELNFVHVAGTKGKGSTAAMLEAILLGLGCHTCCYSSPHLAHAGERYRFNGVPWSHEQYQISHDKIQAAIGVPSRIPRVTFKTTFEIQTTIALLEFLNHKRRCQTLDTDRHIVCWETGLGGRLDCTNVVTPLVAVLTPIGFDHMAVLGNTLAAIASEKCGIIKPGRPVVVARQTPDHCDTVLQMIHRTARVAGSKVVHAWDFTPVELVREEERGQVVRVTLPNNTEEVRLLPLWGAFQRTNLEAAVSAAWLAIEKLFPSCGKGDFLRGLPNVSWPGRLEIVRSPKRKPLVLDGAQCPLSACAVGRSLDGLRGSVLSGCPGSWTLLWSMQRDKDHDGFLRALQATPFARFLSRVYTYPIGGERGSDPEQLARVAAGCGFEAVSCPSIAAAVEGCLLDDRPTVALGTLYSLHAIRQSWLAK